MQGISIFKQTYAAGASRVVMGFDSAINTYSPYAIGCIVGKSYAMAAAVVDEDSDHWHIVNLNTKHGFDAVAVLGAIDEDAAVSIAMRDFGRFKESAMWDSVIATNTGGLKRYIDSPLCVKGRKVFTGEIGAMQDMAAGQKILWDGICLQSHQGSSRVLLSDMVQHDDESALVEKFDGLNAWLAESDVEVMEFDALVVENYRLEQTMAKLASAMGAASGQGGVSVTNVTQTKAVKLRNSGAIQVGVSFELSDGQAVTAIFNHADSETQKLGLKDTLFSWKWKLNSRDISAAVQPNNFENVKLDILAGRIMKLVNANSARFQRSQAKKLENEQALADGNARIAEKKATLESLKSEIESLHIQADEKAKADQAAIETKVEDQPQEIDIVNLEKMGVVQITDQGSENIYFVKDGREYYAKVQNTEDYPVGEFDLGKYPQGLPRTSAVDPALDTEEAPMPATNPKDADLNYIKSVIDGSLKADTPDSIKDLNDQIARITKAQMTNPDDRLDGLLTRAIDIAFNAKPSRSATNPDAEYLQAIIDGTADLSVAGDELERIGDNLSPETEDLFEQAAEAFAQYAISLEV